MVYNSREHQGPLKYPVSLIIRSMGPILLTSIKFNPSMYK